MALPSMSDSRNEVFDFPDKEKAETMYAIIKRYDE